MEQRRSIYHAKPFSIHFNVYIRENCYIWWQSALVEWFKALILVTSPLVRKGSNPILDKSFFIFYFFIFLVFFFSAYKSCIDCFNIREIVVLYALGMPPPPPPRFFWLLENAYGWRPAAPWLFSFESCATFNFFFLKIGPTVTRSHDLLSLHVSPKIAHFLDLCTKHMEKSFFLKTDQPWVIGSCLKFRWLFLKSK